MNLARTSISTRLRLSPIASGTERVREDALGLQATENSRSHRESRALRRRERRLTIDQGDRSVLYDVVRGDPAGRIVEVDQSIRESEIVSQSRIDLA